MSMRLQEIHPALVHFPIALLPTALAADALGRLTGSETLLEVGRRAMPLVAASAAVSGAFGLVSQQAVELDDETTDILITHRNINIAAIGLTFEMARRRLRTRRPSLGYLATGLAGLLAVSYSAYLGGHMVYEHGVGVNRAGGLDEERAPRLLPRNAARAARLTAQQLAEGAALTVQEFGEGKLVPWLTRRDHEEHEPDSIPDRFRDEPGRAPVH